MRNAVWCLALVVGFSIAHAQSTTTGAVQGRVTDADSGEPLGGVTVTIGTQIAITDTDGSFKITGLDPGRGRTTVESVDKIHEEGNLTTLVDRRLGEQLPANVGRISH